MSWVYSISLGAFYLGLAPAVLAGMLFRGKYRRGLGDRLGAVAPWEGPDAPIWLHAVSVGEVMAAAPLARAIRARHPEIPLLVSTTTETGRAVAEQRILATRLVFFPLDFGWAVRRAITRLRPRLVLLTETELWPNFLAACARRGIPVVVVNGRLSPRSFPRYRLIRWWFGRVLRCVRMFCMQSARDAERIVALGAPVDRVRVTGNLKYDFPGLERSVDVSAVRRTLGLEKGRPLVVAGSTHRGEEEAIVDAFRQAVEGRPDLCLLLAPRHPERLDEVERLVRRAGLPCVRRSRAASTPPPNGGVILLDTMGELVGLYAVATLVFVGGSLVPHGGQNILEPAAHGRPVIHGPHMENFAEMRDRFQEAGAAIQVEDTTSLLRAMERLLNAPPEAERMGKAGQGIVAAERGATERTADLVDALL